MPNTTTNYGFKKPTTNENVDINVLNENMDMIDRELAKLALKPMILTSTLKAGKTAITLNDSSIATTSVIDVYASVYGVNPISISVDIGTITLEFDAQESDISIRVEVR